MSGNQLLRKQLELARFERTMDYAAANAQGQKHLNQNELAQLNAMLTGSNDDPWRTEPVRLQLPSGREEQMAVVSNPMIRARDIIHQARDMAAQGDVVEAASNLYTQLVLSHLFKDANRRTAVAATCWLLAENGIEVPSMGLLEVGLGDLRSAGQMEVVKGLISNTISMTRSRKN